MTVVSIRRVLAALALAGLTTPAVSQKALPPGEIRANGDITFGNTLKLGKREGNKTILMPDALSAPEIKPSPTADETSTVNRLSLQSFSNCPSVSQGVAKASACANYLSPDGKTFMWNLGLVSDARSPSGDKVTLYTAFEGHTGSACGWARNALTKMFKGSGGSIVDEIDLNNFDCDVGGPVHPGNCEKPKSAIGLLITGLSRNEQGVGGAARAAIVITTPQENLWRHGLSFEGPAIVDSELFTNSNSDRVFDVRGSHLFGLDMNSASFAGSAISMSYGGTNHHIAWRGGAGIVFNIATDNNLGALIFSAGSGGNTLFKTDGSWTMPKALTVSGPIDAKGGLKAANLPTSGTAKGTVCVTATGDFYVKTTPGGCL